MLGLSFGNAPSSTRLSAVSAAKYLPSGEKATHLTPLVSPSAFPVKVRTSLPVAAFQTLQVLSPSPVASHFPSGE